MIKRDIAKVKRLATAKRQQAATRRSIRAHANVWSGLALDFPGFNRQFSTANVGSTQNPGSLVGQPG